MNQKTKLEKGITLIALVITIIVLLILAGVTISMLTGENGLLTKAVSAKETTEKAEIIEAIQLEILGKQTENKGGDITQAELEEILGKYVEDAKTDIAINEDGTIKEIVTKKGNYIIALSEIWSGELLEKDTRTVMEQATAAMPAEASILTGTTEETGIVMIDSKSNEWVWIEVPSSVFTTAKSGADYEGIYTDLNSYATDYRNGSSSQSCNWTDEWYDYLGTTYDGTNEYSKVTYITCSSYFTKAKTYYGTIYTNNTGTEKADSYTSGKTYYAKITDKLTDTSGCGLTYEQYNTNYKKMLTSIYNNKGFYIARYEAGISGSDDEDTTLARYSHTNITSTSTVAVSKQDMIPYNNIYCSEAQILASGMETGDKTSSLMFGIQWDLVCKFLEVNVQWSIPEGKDDTYYIKSNSASWGNCYDSRLTLSRGKYNISPSSSSSTWTAYDTSTENYVTDSTTATSKGILLTTGASEGTNKMNIYDFAGNEWEWTLEHATSDTTYPCAFRGGVFSITDSDYPASYRYNSTTEYCSSYGGIAFRASLY